MPDQQHRVVCTSKSALSIVPSRTLLKLPEAHIFCQSGNVMYYLLLTSVAVHVRRTVHVGQRRALAIEQGCMQAKYAMWACSPFHALPTILCWIDAIIMGGNYTGAACIGTQPFMAWNAIIQGESIC